MPEQRKQNDDRQRHAEQPKQNSASHTHGVSPLEAIKPFGSVEGVSNALTTSKQKSGSNVGTPAIRAASSAVDQFDTRREQLGRLCD
jgi:hypothetical protein